MDGAKGLKISLNFIFLLIMSLIFFPLGSAKIDLFPRALAPHSKRSLNKPIIFFCIIFFTINLIILFSFFINLILNFLFIFLLYKIFFI